MSEFARFFCRNCDNKCFSLIENKTIFQIPDDDKGSENKKKSSIFASFKDKLTKSGMLQFSCTIES